MKWKLLIKNITDQLDDYKGLSTDSRIPKISKWLIAISMAYLISPIGIIPDFDPVPGYLGNLILVSGLFFMIFMGKAFILSNCKQEVSIKYISI